MNAFEAVTRFFEQSAERLGLDEGLRQALATPRREVRVQVRVPMDDGEMAVFPGYRVQHNAARGPPGEGLDVRRVQREVRRPPGDPPRQADRGRRIARAGAGDRARWAPLPRTHRGG